jgi:hypothetical protein
MRALLMTLDAAMVSSLTPGSSVPVLARALARRGVRSYDRAVSCFGLLSRLMPGLPDVVEQLACTVDHLPFDHDCARLVARGSNASVYLLERGDRRSVLKVYRDTLGRSRKELLRSATARRTQYELVVEWYGGVSGLILPSSIVVIPGPLLARPVIAVVQPFVGDDRRDLFTELSLDELRRLAKRCARFRSQIVRFVEITSRLFERDGALLDIVGPDNVVVTGDGENCDLAVIDFGVVDLERMRSHQAQRHAELVERMRWLQRCRTQLLHSGPEGSC